MSTIEEITLAILAVTGGEEPTELQLSSLRVRQSTDSFWVQVARKLFPEITWTKALEKRARKCYRIYRTFGSHLLEEVRRNSSNLKSIHNVSCAAQPSDASSQNDKREICSADVSVPPSQFNGSFHQGNMKPTITEQSIGTQCCAMSVAALAFACIVEPNLWMAAELDEILRVGDQLYVESVTENKLGFRMLCPAEVKRNFQIREIEITVDIEDDPEVFGYFNPTEEWQLDVTGGLKAFFGCSGAGVVTAHGYTVAVWKKDKQFWIFDSHSRDTAGKYNINGASFCGRFGSLDALVKCFMQNHDCTSKEGFTITKVEVSVCSPETKASSFPKLVDSTDDSVSVLDESFNEPQISKSQTPKRVSASPERRNAPIGFDDKSIHNQSVTPTSKSEAPKTIPRKTCRQGYNISTPKRCMSYLQPARHTEVTKKLGIKLNFSSFLKKDIWEQFYVAGSRRLKRYNEEGEQWTNHFARIFKEGNEFCCLKFNTQKILSSPAKRRQKALHIALAQCKMKGCFAFKFFVMEDSSNIEDLQVVVTTLGQFTHQGDSHRRHVTGGERATIKQMTDHDPPNEVKIAKIHEKAETNQLPLQYGNFDNAPSQAAVQKMSSERNLESDLDPDVWTDLLKTADELRHDFKGKVVRLLCRIPFQVIWMTDEQCKLYCSRKGPFTLHIDATGSVISKLSWTDSDVHHYAISMKMDPGKPPIPISEFLTEVKNTTKISGWLQTWQDDVAKVSGSRTCPNPTVVVMDFSWAIIHSAIRSFCNLNVIQYLESTMRSKSDGKVNHTVVQLCVSHVIHAVALHLSDLVPKTPQGKQLRSLALHAFAALQRSDDLGEAKSILKYCAHIFDSPFVTNDVIQSLDGMSAVLGTDAEENYLVDNPLSLETIRSEIKSAYDVPKDDSTALWKQSPFTLEFTSILPSNERHFTEQEAEPNPFFISGYTKYLLVHYLPYYPMWSCYTMRLIGYDEVNPPSNWPAETYFNITKNQMLNKKLHQTPGRLLRITVPKVQQRLSDAKYDTSIKKYGKSKSARPEDIRHAEDKWKRRKAKEKRVSKGEGAYSLKAADSKFRSGSRIDYLIKTLKTKYKRLSGCKDVKMAQSSPVSPGSDNNNIQIPEFVYRNDGDKTPLSVGDTTNAHIHVGESCKKRLQFCPTPSKEVLTNPWDNEETWPRVIEPNISYGSEVIVLPGGRISLYTENLKSLLQGEYLNNHCIDAFLSSRCKIAESAHAKIYNIACDFLPNIIKGDKRSSHILKEIRADITSNDVLLVPFNESGNHWCLIVMSFSHKIVIYFDSLLLTPNKEAVSYLQGFISSEYRKKNATNFDWSDWTYYRPVDIPKQENGYDCGVHVCIWSHVICSRSAFSSIKGDESVKIRMWIMKEIINSQGRQVPATYTKKGKSENLSVSKLRKDVKFVESVPFPYNSTMDLTLSILRTLFKSADGVCALGNKCIAVGEEEFFCESHRDFFHLECVQDTSPDVGLLKREYKCPTCRSGPKKKGWTKRKPLCQQRQHEEMPEAERH